MLQNRLFCVSYDLLGIYQYKLDWNVALRYTNEDLGEECNMLSELTKLQGYVLL